MIRATQTHMAIDSGCLLTAENGNRWHLGASIIGRPCAREIWYKHRWALNTIPPPRILRLFNRGHLEEARIVEWLRNAGIAVSDKDETGNQHRVLDSTGHFGGSLDALLFGVPDRPGEEMLGEFKTHNDKSFANLSARGVAAAKPEHVVQMCVYMGERGLSHGLYIGVNKNDDDIHPEIVAYDPDIHRQATERAHSILNTDEPPPRISDTPTFWICRNCDMAPICHGMERPDINCRTCAHVAIGPNGTWNCTKHGYVFTKDLEAEESDERHTAICNADIRGEWIKGQPRMADGCADHVFNPHMLNGVEFMGGNQEGNYTILKFKDGTIIEQGPTRVPSDQLCLSDPSPIKKNPSSKASRSSTRKTKGTA